MLRVGAYPGRPTSLVRVAQERSLGLSVEPGQDFAARLGVPYQQVEFPRLALVLEALQAGEVDCTVTNATPVRARDMNFSPPVIAPELGRTQDPVVQRRRRRPLPPEAFGQLIEREIARWKPVISSERVKAD